ncbi:MAG: fructosamine kinase family protein [Flavobacteriales bacterium]|nr:fructosamine kinase family protein [Flavobacteriales bacterium]MBP9078767.1 fructosamine kinase family protein [Flavobacteriales bacterium]
MSLPRPALLHLEGLLTERSGNALAIIQAVPVHGGSINDTYRLETDRGDLFLKVNTSDQFPSLFIAEARGLELLRSTQVLRVPNTIAQGSWDDTTFLVLEYIPPANEEEPGLQTRFGRALAKLHGHSQTNFGLDHDNHIGLLPQGNTPYATWAEFMVRCRFEPLVQLARNNQRIHAGDVFRFERLYGRLPDLFPVEAPSLLHGDLWKNNYIATTAGEPVLIDPAVYYGHREMDLAMTRLFGGFHRDFYRAYHEEAPLEAGWEQRVDLCNLYPLLVHLNLFGGSYADRVGAVLRRYV